MSDDLDVDQLGRLVFREAGHLRTLSDRMSDLGKQPDGYSPAGLRYLVDALQVFAMRCATSTGNTALLSELSGRDVRPR